MSEFNNVRELSVFLRDEMDKYAGQELPDEFKTLIKILSSNAKYRKMIFKGETFSSSFITIMRPYRIQLIEKILKVI